MNLLLIYAHPPGKSFNLALRQAVLRGAKKGGHRVRIIDLYKENFNPVLTTEELKGALSPDIPPYQEAIRKADWMVFIFPVWWFRAPAILEGWFDRVFSSGFAFKYKTLWGTFGIPRGLLTSKKALVINTYGSPGFMMRWVYADLPWKIVKQGILRFCGIKKLIHFPCYASPFVSKEKRQGWLRKIEKMAAALD